MIINGDIGHELPNVSSLLPNLPNMFPWKLKCLKKKYTFSVVMSFTMKRYKSDVALGIVLKAHICNAFDTRSMLNISKMTLN